jgi:predicted acylesterase/phospholipase RssA
MICSGCATPTRLSPAPPTEIVQPLPGAEHIRFLPYRDVSDFREEAVRAMAKEQAWRSSTGQQGPLPPTYFLAISGGGDSGAFGAGLLKGWTESGTRPEFRVVTGVSTGALIAPFAFLGPKYDYLLERFYTQTPTDQILKKRWIVSAALFNDGLADTRPLYETISKYVDRPMLDAIAAEYAKGRILLVGTTNIDTLEPVIWNMTAIAASKDPHAIVLFRKVLLASASIPGAFPPTMIDVQVDGVRYQEMHVDGGTVGQVFLYPPSLQLAQMSATAGMTRQRTLYIIRNARLDSDPANVKRRTLPIAGRAISSLMKTQGIGDLYRIFVTANRDGLDYNLAYIPPTFTVPHTKDFDPAYMRPLFATGEEMAAKGYPWKKYPPGYEGPGL